MREKAATAANRKSVSGAEMPGNSDATCLEGSQILVRGGVNCCLRVHRKSVSEIVENVSAFC